MLRRFGTALYALRPRTIAQLQKSVADVRTQAAEQREAVRQFREETMATHRAILETLNGIQSEVGVLAAQHRQETEASARLVASIQKDLTALELREAQVRAVAQADLQLAGDLPALEARLREPGTIHSHVRAAVSAATRQDWPFPYMVIDDVLPPDVFAALVRGLPPAVLFADRPVNHQQLRPPFPLAPQYSRRIWDFMAEVVVKKFIRPVVIERFRDPVNDWLRGNFPAVGDNPIEKIGITYWGRVLLRRPGYLIPPHRDPKWAVITMLLYLPRPGDDDRWGTQLYTVAGDDEAPDVRPHWIGDSPCTLAADVAFRPNRLLVFMNSTGAHGAQIPLDAQPADLERYAYQVRLRPSGASMAELVAGLPDDRKALWMGDANVDY
jgi:hypothetical protein